MVKITTEIQILAMFCQKSAEAKEPGTRDTVTYMSSFPVKDTGQGLLLSSSSAPK